jgi:hypothetical protein
MDGRVEAKNDQHYTVSFDGYSFAHNEVVGPERLMRIPPVPDPPPKRGPYLIGEEVVIASMNTRVLGRIVSIEKHGYGVWYDGWASSWDEVVTADRLVRVAKAKATKLRIKKPATAGRKRAPRKIPRVPR